MKQLILLPLIFLFGIGCASLPPKEIPVTSTSSILGVDLAFPGFLPYKFLERSPVQVFFIKAPRRGDISRADKVLPASWIKGNRAYLLNPEPGTYYVVAGNFEVKQAAQEGASTSLGSGVTLSVSAGGGTFGHSVIMNDQFIRQTKTSVRPAQVAFMGKLRIKDGERINAKAQLNDELQKKIAELVNPGSTTKTGISGFFSRVWMLQVEKSSYANGEAERNEFIQNTKKDFAKSPWASLVGAPAAR